MGGWPNYFAFIIPVSGGKGGQTTLVSPRKNFADMAPKEPGFIDIMNKSMSEEETKAFLPGLFYGAPGVARRALTGAVPGNRREDAPPTPKLICGRDRRSRSRLCSAITSVLHGRPRALPFPPDHYSNYLKTVNMVF